jgi:hypothetical protein
MILAQMGAKQGGYHMYIDYQTLIIIVLATFMVGLIIGIRITRPKYDRY